MEIEQKRVLDILYGISAYNVFLAIVFASIGHPESSLPTFFGLLATFVASIAALIKRVSVGGGA